MKGFLKEKVIAQIPNNKNNPIENVFFNISTELDVSAGDWIYFVKIIQLLSSE